MLQTPPLAQRAAHGTHFPVLAAISISHLLNDAIQSLIPAIYPILKSSFQLTFTQIGLITFTLQLTASVLQPLVGLYTDRHSTPYSLVAGMGVSLAGLLVLSFAPSLTMLLVAAAMIGLGSAIFHPESSRVARMASGGQHGLAQSIFQVGGNFGSSLGPLLAAFVVAPRGQSSIAWCSLVAAVAMVLLWRIGGWHRMRIATPASPGTSRTPAARRSPLSRRRIAASIAILVALIFSKYFYLYAQELVPNRVGLIAGLFFGLAFGVAGIGAAVLGRLADHTSIEFVYRVCAFLPLIGLLAGFLPDIERKARSATFGVPDP